MSNENLDTLKSVRESLKNANWTLESKSVQERAEKQMEDESPASLLQRVKDIAITARRINKVFDAAIDLYQKVSPWIGPVLRPIGWTAGKLKDAFVWAAYEREDGKQKLDADGDPIFSAGRLARTFALAAMIGISSVAGLQTAYFHATKFSEIVYVTGKQEIEAGDLYQFTGCTSLPCSTATDNGKYYQVEESWFSPRLVYPEQDVYANIPNQMAACQVDGYGLYFKQLKPFFKWTELYQHVYNVSCRPLTPQEIQNAMQPTI